RLGRGTLYMSTFQAPDAHGIFETDVATALRKGFYAYDGATPDDRQSTGFIAEGQDFISEVADDATLPPWMSADHFAEYVAAFSAGGFKGPMDWYRCMDLNWSLTAFVQDRKISVPAAFMVGERDPVRHYSGQHEAGLAVWLTDLRSQTVLPGAGHWIQQERPAEVSRALLDFLKNHRSSNSHG
ncbi:MAG: alpha/beta hydrolase, partial [Alphaproteobacteria bacterium]